MSQKLDMLGKLLKQTKKKIPKKLYKNKITKENQKTILKNINILLMQGYSINESIKLINSKHTQMMQDKFLEGGTFSSCLKALNFDKDLLLIIENSELSGNLAKGIKRAQSILQKKINNKNNILEKLKYPLLLSIVLMLSLLFISNFLLPMFLKVYSNFGIEIDGKFQAFIEILINLPKVLFIIIIIFISIALYMKLLKESDRLKLILKNKFIKNHYYKNYNNLFVVNIYSLISLGIKLDEVFEILSNQKYNYMLKKECRKISKKLYEGEDLVEILKNNKIYSEKIIVAIQQGIEANTLLENLNSLILFEQMKQKEKLEKLILLIQPIIYMVFGLIIVLLYMSIFLPMFKIMDSL